MKLLQHWKDFVETRHDPHDPEAFTQRELNQASKRNTQQTDAMLERFAVEMRSGRVRE